LEGTCWPNDGSDRNMNYYFSSGQPQYRSVNPNNKSRLCDFFTVMLVLMPILDTYTLNIVGKRIGLGMLLVLIIGFVLLLVSPSRNIGRIRKAARALWVYYGYCLLITVVSILILGSDTFSLTIIMNFLYVLILTVFVPKYVNIKLLEKTYHNAVIIVCLYLLMQYLFCNAFRIALPNIIPALPLFSVSMDSSQFLMQYQNAVLAGTARISSIFTESAHFAAYVVPCLSLLLFSNNRKNVIVPAVFISVCVILSFSALGVASVLFIWFFWSVYTLNHKYSKEDKRRNKVKALIIIGTPIVIVLMIYLYLTASEYQFTINRFIAIISGNGDSSSVLRLSRGFKLYSQFGAVWKLFGAGFGSVSEIIHALGILDIYETQFIVNAAGYMSGLSRVFFASGIIGAIFYSRYLLIQFKSNKISIKLLILVALIFLIASDSLFSTFSTLWFSISMYCTANKETCI